MVSSSMRELKKALRLSRQIASRMDGNQVQSDLHALKIRSYIILSHAAIEEYLESLSREIALKSISLLKDENFVSYSLLALISHYKSKFPQTFVVPASSHILRSTLADLSDQAIMKHEKAIDDNHGIRAKSVNNLFYPIGVDADRGYPGLVPALDTFGLKRGRYAHGLGATIVETRNNVDTEVRGIRTMLLEVDKIALECCRSEVEFL
jgi:hypothetical protein